MFQRLLFFVLSLKYRNCFYIIQHELPRNKQIQPIQHKNVFISKGMNNLVIYKVLNKVESKEIEEEKRHEMKYHKCSNVSDKRWNTKHFIWSEKNQ